MITVGAERAFRDDIILDTFCRCHLERLRAWLLTDRAGRAILCRSWLHIQAALRSQSTQPPRTAPQYTRELTGQKGRPRWGHRLAHTPPQPHGAAGLLLRQWQCSAHLVKERRKKDTDGAGGAVEGWELRPLLDHHFAQFKPCDVFLPSPCRPSGYQHLPSPSDQEHRLGCLGIKAPRHKRSVFRFKAGRCPLRICPLKGSTCDCTPCPEPKRDRRQPLAGDISKYERGTKSQVPRPPLLWKTQPGLSRLPGRRGLGAGRIRRQPAETAISPRNIT